MNPTPDASLPIRDATTYDEPRRRLVPDFDLFCGTATELVAPASSLPASARTCPRRTSTP